MSSPLALEEEKEALLERMRMSRAAYRSRLIHSDTVTLNFNNNPENGSRFPRSHVFQIVMHHPYLSALAVMGLWLIGPRRAFDMAVKSGHVITHYLSK
ncbi:hypothetical protein [Rhodoferax sp. UBA5149]|uniref:hypothetical protein n=1 Tax=Rhodoferax sp. UBA5149 TaxID=1947379 RepID=UPI0025D5CDD3|nr:hypothetical protein [Rhodoferax sp. UBA5149]